MAIQKKEISLRDACNLIGKSKDLFAPIKEVMTNALDSIVLRERKKSSFKPHISLKLYFEQGKDLFTKQPAKLSKISVTDNGIGFTTENLFNFKQLANQSKGLNNRGTGIVQVFCRFDDLQIDSNFVENNRSQRINITWNASTSEYDEKSGTPKENHYETVVSMSSFRGNMQEKEFYNRYISDISYLKTDVLKCFLLRMWLDNQKNGLEIEIKTYLNDTERGHFLFDKNTIPTPDKTETVEINTEKAKIIKDKENPDKIRVEWSPVEPSYTLEIQRFKIPTNELDENIVYMCSKGILVQPFFSSIIKRKGTDYKGYRYLTSIQGDLLDKPEYVSQAVDHFQFQDRKEVERNIKNGDLYNQEMKYVLEDELKKKIGQGLEHVYEDVKRIQEDRSENIRKIATTYGISMEDVEATTSISLNDTDEEVTEKLFQTQAKRFAEQSIEIHKTYEELKALETQNLDPTSTEYREKLETLSNKLLEKIPEQNKDELARYIIRRDILVELLRLTLNNKLSIQTEWEENKSRGIAVRQDQEGILHNALFKRKAKGVPNDLWIFNEEFVHFEGCSDLSLDQIEIQGRKLFRDDIDINDALDSVGLAVTEEAGRLRPDIFLYPEEGKCILIELKAPTVDLSQCCDQIQKYAKLIANYAVPEFQFKQFYGFLIGEKTGLIPDRYKKSPYGKYWIYPSEPINNIETGVPIADIYQEIIQLSGLADRAEIRNRSFAEKLGIESKTQKNNKQMESGKTSR